MAGMKPPFEGDLGFAWRTSKEGAIQIVHHGRLATTLRGRRAAAFLAAIESLDRVDAQQLMARMTGNYRRGNERRARNHPRNRG
jgi:hypothetical protein